jgi:hypothetical protein
MDSIDPLSLMNFIGQAEVATGLKVEAEWLRESVRAAFGPKHADVLSVAKSYLARRPDGGNLAPFFDGHVSDSELWPQIQAANWANDDEAVMLGRSLIRMTIRGRRRIARCRELMAEKTTEETRKADEEARKKAESEGRDRIALERTRREAARVAVLWRDSNATPETHHHVVYPEDPASVGPRLHILIPKSRHPEFPPHVPLDYAVMTFPHVRIGPDGKGLDDPPEEDGAR